MNFRNSNDAARYVSQLEDKLANINALAESEERALTSEELEETQGIHAKLEAAEQQRDALAKNEQRLKARAVAADAVVRSDKEAIKANAKFDFGKALREAAHGGVTGLEKEVMQEARKEASALGLGLRGDFSIPQSMMIEARNVYGVDSGQSGVNDAVTTVATEVTALVGALRSNSLLAATGATQLNGFVGDIKMPSLPTDAAEEPAEGASITGNTGSMGQQTLSPQRIAQQMIVTKEAINQTNGNMASVIAADFGRAIAIVQDKIALNSIHGTGGSTALAGGTGTVVLATETGTNDMLATTAADIRDLWAEITANGAENNTAFVCHPTSMAYLMGLANVSAVSSLVENGQIFGYNVLSSGSVPSIDAGAVYASQLIEGGADVALGAATGWDALRFVYYGDWSDLFYANWGGLDVTVDPYSGISAGNVKVVVDTFFDAKVRRAGSLGALPFSSANILGADS
jgi:HK97 family phage major capsid protein